MQDPKKPKKKRMFRRVDDPIPTDPDEFDAYQKGEYDEEPFIDYWNREGYKQAVEGAKLGALEMEKMKEEKRKKREMEAKGQAEKAFATRSMYKGSVTQKADATAKRVR